MFPNVDAERARRRLTLEMITKEMNERGFNLTVAMLSQKLSGKYPLRFDEAKAIRDIIAPGMPLDELFEEVA